VNDRTCELARLDLRTTSELERLVLRLKGLVEVRRMLQERGASERELEEHRLEINRVRMRLARLARHAASGPRAA